MDTCIILRAHNNKTLVDMLSMVLRAEAAEADEKEHTEQCPQQARPQSPLLLTQEHLRITEANMHHVALQCKLTEAYTRIAALEREVHALKHGRT